MAIKFGRRQIKGYLALISKRRRVFPMKNMKRKKNRFDSIFKPNSEEVSEEVFETSIFCFNIVCRERFPCSVKIYKYGINKSLMVGSFVRLLLCTSCARLLKIVNKNRTHSPTMRWLPFIIWVYRCLFINIAVRNNRSEISVILLSEKSSFAAFD